MCPHSPAIPYEPRKSLPPITSPPPMPVPSVMQTITDEPRPAPKRYSAQASSVRVVVHNQRYVNPPGEPRLSGSDRQARGGENRTTALIAVHQPAAPMPTASTRCRLRNASTARRIASSTACGLWTGSAPANDRGFHPPHQRPQQPPSCRQCRRRCSAAVQSWPCCDARVPRVVSLPPCS